MNNQETICAVSTAQGGAIGIVRVSGSDSITTCGKLFRSPHGEKQLADYPFRHAIYGTLISPDENDEIIDEVVVLKYKGPHSYTGEDSVEIMCHGSTYILEKVMSLLITEGCRLARPGEYTQRAFLNGKMDLSQAEAVADLISSSTAATHRLAMSQMRGGFSRELRQLRDKLLKLTSLMELELDFSEEDLEFADRQELKTLSKEIESTLSHLISSFKVGNALKNGVPVAIIGETNVGKSTLLNQLLHEDRAIVSEIHGTTRDTIEDTINIDGTLFRFIDTAGIRETSDKIETIGIDRTFQKIDEAEIVLWVTDATYLKDSFESTYSRIIPHIGDKTLIVVVNKCDLVDETDLYSVFTDLYDHTGINPDETILISAKTGKNINALESKLLDYTNNVSSAEGDVIVTNLRHVEALKSALNSLQASRTALENGLSTDLVAEDLRMCLSSLGEIVGEVTTDEVLGNIFKNFCVGK